MLHSLEFRAMGCSATIQLQGPTEASHVLDQVPEQIAKIEAQLTRFQPDSNLMQSVFLVEFNNNNSTAPTILIASLERFRTAAPGLIGPSTVRTRICTLFFLSWLLFEYGPHEMVSSLFW